MHKNKTSSLVILLVTSIILSAFAGSQFVATAVAAGYTETVGNLDGVNFVVRFPDTWNGMLVVITQAGGATPVLDARTTDYNLTAVGLLNKGYAVAASNYGGAIGYCHSKAVNSTYTVTKYIVDTYHITGKIFLMGGSMGGNFALFLGQKYPELFDGVLDIGGSKDAKSHYAYYDTLANLTVPQIRSYLNAPSSVTDAVLQSLKDFSVTALGYYQNETGGTPQQVPQAYEDRSNTYHANITIPVITIHSSSDVLVPVSQTTMYQAAVAAAGRSSLYRVYITPPSVNTATQAPIRFDELVGWSSTLQDWTLTVDGRGMKAYPDLKEYVWQRNASAPPNGPYDKIGLHRLVKTGVTPKGVVFLTNCPTWGMGETRISNPTSDTWTKYENYSQAIYWANRGFDVYAIDYRPHFAPQNLSANQTSFAANWGLDMWISDTKDAAEKVKEVSGSQKFFISGECTGAFTALNYATKYWKTDLKGIILLDANSFVQGYPILRVANGNSTFNLTAVTNSMNAISNWTYNPFGALAPIAAYALQNPGAPAQYPPGTPLSPPTNPATNKTWANITEWVVGTVNVIYTNITGGWGDISQIEYNFAKTEFLPLRFLVEMVAMIDWANCPFLPFDYNDHYNEIGVPILAFDTQLFSNRTGALQFVNGINSTDFTGVMLRNYGHLDVYIGTFSARDVSEPAYQWMLGHLSSLDVSAFQSVTLIPGWTWNFFAQNIGGSAPYKYQWYEGLNPIQGQTSMVLPVTKTAPGLYSFYCRVTDKDGTTTTSNAVTLTVIG